MFFKKLELYGFKSFVDKTELAFEPGVICIVGPNGCGKTNLADAIKWSLGEQSAKSMRGAKMEDVIFNGTESRKALGMAEVSLTMANVKDSLAVDFEEVMVTRRVYRSGESEYMMNKTQARLKDIEELFMDTGVGTNAYSILEQGKMDLVLSAKPIDRRYLFEEAAGIAKFKARKEEAMRKLDGAEQNLLRVSDIITEIKRQIISLERQAKRAEKYKIVSEELKSVEVKAMKAEYAKKIRELKAIAEEQKEYSKTTDEANSHLTAEEAKIEEIKLTLLEKEKILNATHRKVNDIDRELHKTENNIVLMQERKLNLREYKEKTIAEIEIINKRIEETLSNMEKSKNSCEEAKIKIKEISSYIEEKERELGNYSEKFTVKEKEVDFARSSLMKMLESKSGIQNELNKAEVEQNSIKKSMEGLLCEKEQFVKNKKYILEMKNNYEKAGELLGNLHNKLVEISAGNEGIRELIDIAENIKQLIRNAADSCLNLENENVHWESEPSALENKHGEMSVLLGQLQGKSTELKSKLSSIENECKAKQEEVDRIENAYKEEYASYSRENTSLYEQKALFASLSEKISNYGDEAQKLNNYVEELKMDSEKKKSEISSCDDRASGLDNEEKEYQNQLEQAFAKKTEIEKEVKEKEDEYNAVKEVVIKHEKEIKVKRDNFRELNEKLHGVELKKSQFEMEIKNITESVKKDYSVDLNAEEESSLAEIPAEETEELMKKAEELRQKLEEIGPVNMVAMEEYNELKERYEFLSNQEKDLRDAKESLIKTINTINQTTKSMFAEAFEKIRENFKNTFRKLFNGGMAELVLVDEGNLLETGIDIVARPPGKKLQSISLLSGGERALTAIALLFALFELKPSPFCVLDEIDAPLDEVNVKRFTSMVREFSKNTQFIIITHNKLTMEIADVLYGVTMEEPGVSKIISMKLKGKAKETKEEVLVA